MFVVTLFNSEDTEYFLLTQEQWESVGAATDLCAGIWQNDNITASSLPRFDRLRDLFGHCRSHDITIEDSAEGMAY